MRSKFEFACVVVCFTVVPALFALMIAQGAHEILRAAVKAAIVEVLEEQKADRK